VIATDDQRRLHLAGANQLVERQADLGAIAVAEPADARRQPLELDALAGELEPAAEIGVVRHDLEHGGIGDGDVLGIARKSDPAEGPLPFAEERPQVERHEAHDLEARLHPPSSAPARMLLP